MSRLTRPRTLIALATASAALAVPAAAGAVTLTGSGSSAAQPYMLELFKAYSKLHRSVRFKYIADGGNAGVKDVQAGRSQFSINTRPPQPSDAGTTYVKLFLDALCIDVNKANSVTNAPLNTLKNIFLGVDTSWSQVAGSNLTTTIDPIGRNSAAGQYTFFQQSVLGGATQSSNVAQDTSDGLVQTSVEKDPNAIGYVGLAHSIGREADLGQRGDLHGVARPQQVLPAVPLRLGRDPHGSPERRGRELLRLGADEQGGRHDHQPGRRGGGLQQEVAEQSWACPPHPTITSPWTRNSSSNRPPTD